MLDGMKCIAALLVYFLLFFVFGIWFRHLTGKKEMSLSSTLMMGFFCYYALFQVVTVPLMFSLQPLSLLTRVWSAAAAVFTVAGLWVCRRDIHTLWKRTAEGWRKNRWAFLLAALVVTANVVFVSVLYSSYYDATFYVGTVSYSVHYNTINTIAPLSGVTMDMFDMKHCFATYHMNDAVFCQLFNLHPLIETKTVMVVVVTVMANLIYYQIAGKMLRGDWLQASFMLGFILLINLCTYSSFTASSFLLFRTYEGKAVTGTVTMSALLLVFLELNQEHRRGRDWLAVGMIAWGAVAVSSSAMFLVPVAVMAYAGALWICRKDWKCVPIAFFCCIPCFAILGCYFLSRMGIFYVYAHPIG